MEAARGLPDRRWRITLSNLTLKDGKEKLPGLANWTWDAAPIDSAPVPGMQVCLTRPILPLRGFHNDAVSLRELGSRADGIHWRIWSRGEGGGPEFSGRPCFLQALRWRLRQKMLELLREPDSGDLPPARALLPALIFGDRFFLPQSAADSFSMAALAHSLALSGQHLAIAALAGLFCVLAAARFHPQIYLRRPRLVLAALAACPAALLYLWIGDAPPSLLRAACMLLAVCFFVTRYRSYSGLDVIFLALAIFLLCWPMSVLDIGMQLSFLCVFAIALFLPALKTTRPFRPLKEAHDTPEYRGSAKFRALAAGRYFAQILAISLLVQTALLPLSLKYFGQAGLWFPLNALWLPLLGAIVLPCAALGLVASIFPFAESLARLLLMSATLPCQGLLISLEWLQKVNFLVEPVFMRPHWCDLAAFAILLICLAVLAASGKGKLGSGRKDRIRISLAAGLVLLLVAPAFRLARSLEERLSLDVLDVGQGQALLLQLPAGQRILIDGGGSISSRFDPGKALIAPLLLDNAPPRLEAVVNSHPDLDHLGGLFYLLHKLEVGGFLHNGRPANGQHRALWEKAANAPNARVPVAGDTLSAGRGGLYLEVLHPPASDWNGNNASLILRLCRDGEGLALIPGDAEKPALRALLASGRDISAMVLIAPHHGSNSSFLAAFYRAVRPRIVIASCGFHNRYGYPGSKLRGWAQKNGIPLFNTGEHGRVSVDFPPSGLPKIHTATGENPRENGKECGNAQGNRPNLIWPKLF